ncbi:MAG: IPTL-CTERM sorting domain-containing protein [Chitinophagales bacterium]
MSYAGGDGNDVTLSYSAIQIAGNNGGDVPTLSQWGLIILALLLMTLGTLHLLQPNQITVKN